MKESKAGREWIKEEGRSATFKMNRNEMRRRGERDGSKRKDERRSNGTRRDS